MIKEGQTYIISNFGIGQNMGKNHATTHLYKLNILFHTNIRKCSPFDLTKSQFDFISIDEIKAQTEEEDKILRGLIY